MKKQLTLLAGVIALCLLAGCTGLAKTVQQLKGDNATVDLVTPWGSFHRSMPPVINVPGIPLAPPVIIDTNVSVVVPLRLQVNQ